MTKNLLDRKKIQFYLWVGLAYMILALFNDLSHFPGTFGVSLVNECWRAIFVSGVNYLFFEKGLSFIRQRRTSVLFHIIATVLILFGYLILYSLGMYAWRSLGILFHIYTEMRSFNSIEDGITFYFSYSVGSFFFFGLIRHIYNYTRLKTIAQQLRIEKQAAELNYLRSQTNPHFLFNTLNNIYSLARDKSALAPDSILRLSKILRFMLYDTSGDFIAIEDELKIIDDYIALEQLRYDDSLRVNFNHDIEDKKQALPPLLLIPLIENAFKHGVSETRNQPFIDIHLSVNQRQLKLIIKNSADSEQEKKVRENIGISNLRRQLELLYSDYSLLLTPGESVFTAILKINLSSHV